MTTGGRSRFSVPPPRPIAWALAYTCWIAYAVLDFGPQLRDIIKVFPWSQWWGFDGDLVLQAGRRFLDGQPIYADSRFMYAPAAAVFGIAGALVFLVAFFVAARLLGSDELAIVRSAASRRRTKAQAR